RDVSNLSHASVEGKVEGTEARSGLRGKGPDRHLVAGLNYQANGHPETGTKLGSLRLNNGPQLQTELLAIPCELTRWRPVGIWRWCKAMAEEQGFLQALHKRPDDLALRLAFADWLEVRGDPRGELSRLAHTLTQSISIPNCPELEERLRTLLEQGVQPIGPF